MRDQHQALRNRIAQVCRQWKKLVVIKGCSQVFLSTLTAFLLAFALDTLFDLHHVVRIFLLVGIGLVFFTTLFFEIIRPLRNTPTEKQVARYLEEKHDLEDRLVTAVELGGKEDPRISKQILEKLLDDAQIHIDPINLQKSLQSRTPMFWGSAALAASLLFGAFLFSNFDTFTLKSNRLFTPWKFPTLKPKSGLTVTPGDARVPRGSSQEIKAEINGFEADDVRLYYSTDDSSWHKMQMDATLEEGVYVYNFFTLDSETKYYVKADSKISDIFKFSVYDAPQIKRIDLSYTFPKYTGLKRKQEKDGGDIWAPEGTVVKITAVADKALRTASIVVGENTKLKVSILKDSLVTATLTVTNDTFYKILITDHDNLSNNLPPEYYIHALPDQPPVLTLEWPGRDIKASMVEEVPIRIRVEEDYGAPSLSLHYAVNGSEEIQIDLQVKNSLNQSEEGVREFNSGHLFYLEDFGVKPGDFLTYYVQAGDKRNSKNAQMTTSEIYFIEVRPFEKEFYRALSQGGMGGSAGGQSQLSRPQKDIVVATWKLLQRKDKLQPDELSGDIKVITESQKNLLEGIQSALFQMEQRSLFSGQSTGEITQYYSEALESMHQAVIELEAEKIEEALPPEKEALSALLAAEAQIKETQLSQGGGAGNSANLEELSQLFEEELDKLNNKYETLQQNQQHRDDKELSDALRKVKDLARRQQQFNKKMRELASKPEEEKRRRIEELRRQQEEIRRQVQELAKQTRQMQRQNSRLSREMQESLRRAANEMNNTSNSLRNKNTAVAAAKGSRALNRLQQLENMLKRNQKESMRRQVDELEQKFQRMADAQKKLADKVEQMSGADENLDKQLQQASEGQNRIKEDLADAKERLESLSQQARDSQHKVSRDITQLSQEMERSQIEQKMAQAQKLLQDKKLNSAKQAEKDLARSLAQLEKQMTHLQGALAETEEEKLDLALNQTRKLREDLESMQRKAESLSRRNRENSNGQEMTRQGGTRQQAGSGESRGGQKLDPAKMDWWNEELAKRLQDMDFINQATQVDSSLTQDARQIGENMQSIMRSFTGGVAGRMKLIEQQVLDPLKRLEAELAQKLELIQNKEKLFLARDEAIPQEYKELVEKYYEALSK